MPHLCPICTQLTPPPKGDVAASYYTHMESEWPSQRGEEPPCTRTPSLFLPSLGDIRQALHRPHATAAPPAGTAGPRWVRVCSLSQMPGLLLRGCRVLIRSAWPPSGGLNWEENLRLRPCAQWKEPGVHPNCHAMAWGSGRSSCQRNAFLTPSGTARP